MTAANGLTAQHAPVPGGLHDDQRASVAAVGGHDRLDVERQELGGIPYEWMTNYFGAATNSWPAATADRDGDGVNNLNDISEPAAIRPTPPASCRRDWSARRRACS